MAVLLLPTPRLGWRVMPGFMPGIHDFLRLARGTAGNSTLTLEFRARDRLEVAVPDHFLVRLGHVDAFKNAQGFARVHCALLGIERAVRREYDLVGVVERKTRMGRRHAAEHRGVGIEGVLEIIEWTLLELLQDGAQVFV